MNENTQRIEDILKSLDFDSLYSLNTEIKDYLERLKKIEMTDEEIANFLKEERHKKRKTKKDDEDE